MAKNDDHKGSDRISTTLGRETDFNGTMRFRDSLKIDGSFTGEIVSGGFLAKQEIHQIIKALAERGIGILMISDEVAEVVANSHRIMLMGEGRLGAEMDAARTSESEVLEKLNEKQGTKPEVLK